MYLQRQSFLPSEKMKYEAVRLGTFNNWPAYNRARPILLAKAGFFYTGTGDNVQCFSCGCMIGGWTTNMMPENVHSEFSPDCSFYQGNEGQNVSFHVPEETEYREIKEKLRQQYRDQEFVCARQMSNRPATSSRGIPGIAATSSENVLFPQYEKVYQRMQSFSRANRQALLNPNVSEAGFFHDSATDMPRCSCCGMTLNSWNLNHNPFVIHERESPDCHYIGNPEDVLQSLGIVPDQTLTKDQMLDVLRQVTKSVSDHLSLTQDSTKTEIRSLANENRRLREESHCRICLNEPVDIVFLPCGHLVCCTGCSSSCSQCPVCDRRIWARVTASWAGNSNWKQQCCTNYHYE